MTHEPFSVAISVYKNDRADHFDRALESITDKQTILPSEVVLIVDGPVGAEIDQIIEKYTAKYDIFNVIRFPQNKGLGNALRVAVDHCSHELIARMDSDDISLPDRFEQQLACFLKLPQTDIVGGDISEFVGNEDNVVGIRKVPVENSEIQEYMKTRCAMNHVSVMYKKQAVISAGGYLDLFWNEDYYLWIRMQLNGAHFANTGTILVNVRTGEDMYARRGGKKYFESEKFLQDHMLEHKMINKTTYASNLLKRWIVQRCLPNSIRGFVFRKLARVKK